ncbi:MAG: hypothetical protein EOO30_10090 [Comamonadaceae bacterium]|nr:MAG: hypothetical protein EOO30_10090 [Comamonadaceae bacterium]
MRKAALFLAMISSGAAFADVEASIELLADATVRGGVVTLGQVARLQSSDLALMRTLVDLPIAQTPRLGEAALLGPADVDRRLRQRTGQSVRVTWGGADQVRVQRLRHRVKGEAIAEAAAGALRRWLSAASSPAEVHVAAVPRDVDVEGSEVRLQPRPPSGHPSRARSIVWVDLWSAESFVRSVPVSLEVPFAGEGLSRRARAAEGVLGAGPARGAVHPSALAVERGEWAALRTTLGGVLLESRVQVLQDGREGERIRVRQQGATGLVFARVVERGLLELAP